MKNQSVEYVEVKKITALTGNNKFYKINRKLIQDFFLKDEKILEADIYVHRILANIFVNLTDSQFHEKNDEYKMQLNLFDSDFRTLDNSSITFTMNVKEICKDYHYKRIEKALSFLSNYQSQWYSGVNEKGHKIRWYGGMITNSIINQKTGKFKFSVTGHWLERILHLSEFNDTYYNLTQKSKSAKHILFWYWLICLNEKGTAVNYQTLNERFGVNYKDARTFCKDFLRPIKMFFDKHAHLSFNYSYKGNLINISRYNQTSTHFLEHNEVRDTTQKELTKRYKLWYLNQKHSLTPIQKVELKQMFALEPVLMNVSYQNFVSKCKANKIRVTLFKGTSFLKEFQKSIIEEYQKTTISIKYPNAYPEFTLKPDN